MKLPLVFALIVGLAASLALGDEPPPVISIRLVRPDQQLHEVIKLFEGSRAAHPAAALAAWKRASKEPGRLGKPAEAVIAAFNPGMADELRSLDDAEFVARLDEKTGDLVWGAHLPKDDGTFAALAPALALSGGAAEEKLGDLAIDRLGPPGAPLMGRGPRGTFLGGSREGLTLATGRPDQPHEADAREGLFVSIDRGVLDHPKSLTARRLAEVFRIRPDLEPPTSITATVDVPNVVATGVFPIVGVEAKVLAIEPGWLDWIPAERAMVGFAIAIDPTAKSWDRSFDLANRVERADPARAGVAPIRLRLDLLARSVGLRTEVDLYPHLRGISGWAGSDVKKVDAGLLALHFDDEAAANRLAMALRPIPSSPRPANPEPGRPRSLGLVEGRALEVSTAGKTVLLSWGEGALESSNAAREAPGRSAGPFLRQTWGESPIVSYAGAIWPARVPGLLPAGSPLAAAIAGGRPIRWAGAWTPLGLSVTVDLSNLDATVRRFLELIPLDPPPDR